MSWISDWFSKRRADAIRTEEIGKRREIADALGSTFIPAAPDETLLGSGWGIPVESCAWCGSKKDLNVHHIVPQHVDPERAYDKSNMVVLCRPCHFTLGHQCHWDSDGTRQVLAMIRVGKLAVDTSRGVGDNSGSLVKQEKERVK